MNTRVALGHGDNFPRLSLYLRCLRPRVENVGNPEMSRHADTGLPTKAFFLYPTDQERAA